MEKLNAAFEPVEKIKCDVADDETVEEQYTVKHINGSSTMNRNSYKIYQRNLESRRSIGRYSLDEAAQFIEDNSKANAKSISTKLKESAETGELTTYLPGSDEVYKVKPRPPESKKSYICFMGYEETYWKDLNEWLEKNEQRLDCRFPDPNALTAPKVAARLPVATQQNDAILNWLKSKNYDPLKLPAPPSGKSGVKKLCRDEICKNHKTLFSSPSVFKTAWDRLRANTAIIDAQ